MSTEPVVPRSTFVTVVAWIFIVLSGFATLVAVLQNLMIWFLFQAPAFGAAMQKAGNEPGVPAFVGWISRFFYVIFLVFLAVSASMLASSIGLLQRRNWARIAFILLMALGIAWNLAGVAFGALMLWLFPAMPPMHGGAAPPFAWMMGIVMAFNVVIAIGFSALFYWIIHRLRSPAIRQEFVAS